jgi:hypothetical protein
LNETSDPLPAAKIRGPKILEVSPCSN